MNTAVIAATIFNKEQVAAAPLSAATYTKVTYSGSRFAWIYVPVGYQNDLSNWPLIVFMPGYGSTDRSGGSFNNVNNAGEGLGQYLLAGNFFFNKALIIIPENLIFNVDYGVNEWDASITYMNAHYRVDNNRISHMGLSGGAIGGKDIFINRQSNLTATVHVSGPAIDSAWSTASGIGVWHHQGTADTTFGRTIGGTLYRANGASGSWIDLSPAVRSNYYYGLAHTSAVWDTNVYSPVTQKNNVYEWVLKFHKVPTQQADLHVGYAEKTLDVRDYREALILVNNLSAGGTKTNLLSRLSTLKSTIDKGGNRYIVSFQNSSIGSLGTGYNIFVSPLTTNSAITNIVNDNGGASTVGVKMQQQLDSSGSDANASNVNAAKQKSKGFVYQANISGALVNASVTNGVVRITNVPTGKKVDILVHHHHNAADDDNNAMTAQTAISVTANGTTVTQYSAYNNTEYVYITSVPESSGNVDIAIKNSGTRNALLQVLEFLIY